MGTCLSLASSDGLVKSGARVLDVFDFLYSYQRPAREVDIRTALALPKSSTNDLLKTMVTRGYLAFDALERTYSPSYRLARFGKTVDSIDPAGQGLSSLLDKLRSTIGEVVLLAEPHETKMQIVAIEMDDDDYETRRNFPEGRLLDIISTASGRAYLMTRSEENICWIARRNARFAPAERTPEAINSILGMVRQFSTVNYASSMRHHANCAESLTIAMPLPQKPNHAPLTIAVGGAAQRMKPRIDWITETMRTAIAEHFPQQGLRSAA